MICNNCGLSLKDTVRFCSGCGTSVSANGAATSSRSNAYQAPPPSPVSALFTDPPPPRQTHSVTCVIHSSSVAAGSCVGCGNFYCRDCLNAYSGRNYCRTCATRLSAAPVQNIKPYQYQSPNPSFAQPPAQPYQYYQPAAYQYQPQSIPYAPSVYVKRKEPGVALLLSFLLPGVGQLYNGDVGKGIGFMLGFWVLIWIGIGIVFWIWAMIDAYQSATNINLGRRV